MVTVQGCLQEVPPDNSGSHDLDIRYVDETAATYLDAVDKLQATIPDGWRLLYVRTTDPATPTR